MGTKIFNLSLPSELVAVIDEQAKSEYSTRSDYIKRALIAQLKSRGVLDALGRPKAKQTFTSFEEAKRAHLQASFEARKGEEYTDDIDDAEGADEDETGQ